jgi:hypothetical protein
VARATATNPNSPRPIVTGITSGFRMIRTASSRTTPKAKAGTQRAAVYGRARSPNLSRSTWTLDAT